MLEKKTLTILTSKELTTKGSTNKASSPLQAFKRAPSLGLSKWENGNLTNLAEKKDTHGAFLLVEATLAPRTEPPPHVHSREDELFYVLEGEFDVYVGQEGFKVEKGECTFLPKFKPHAFVIRSPRLRVLALGNNHLETDQPRQGGVAVVAP
jgi:mannose-6-phosphate isomerase-like protein (cupin superfamily)